MKYTIYIIRTRLLFVCLFVHQGRTNRQVGMCNFHAPYNKLRFPGEIFNTSPNYMSISLDPPNLKYTVRSVLLIWSSY